jgi:hypothetical protein
LRHLALLSVVLCVFRCQSGNPTTRLPPHRVALLNLTTFHDITTDELIAMARATPGGTKVDIPDRLTASQ